MIMWVVRIGYNPEFCDPTGLQVKSSIRELGFEGIEEVRAFQAYLLEGNISAEEVEKICKELLSDGLVQSFSINGYPAPFLRGGWVVEVRNRPGVTDAVGESTLNAIRILGTDGIKAVRTGMDYLIKSRNAKIDIKSICERVLANKLIHVWRISRQ